MTPPGPAPPCSPWTDQGGGRGAGHNPSLPPDVSRPPTRHHEQGSAFVWRHQIGQTISCSASGFRCRLSSSVTGIDEDSYPESTRGVRELCFTRQKRLPPPPSPMKECAHRVEIKQNLLFTHPSRQHFHSPHNPKCPRFGCCGAPGKGPPSALWLAVHNPRAEALRHAGCSDEEFVAQMAADDCFDAPLTALSAGVRNLMPLLTCLTGPPHCPFAVTAFGFIRRISH